MPEPNYIQNYEDYSAQYCSKDNLEEISEEKCEAKYKVWNSQETDNQQRRNTTSLYGALANVLIVSGVILFLNKEKQPTKKKTSK